MHQMMTLEQYLQVAYIWYAEKQEGYNPFNGSEAEYEELANEINGPLEDKVADDGWVDYNDNVNTVEGKEDDLKHEDKFEIDAAMGQTAHTMKPKSKRQFSPNRKGGKSVR